MTDAPESPTRTTSFTTAPSVRPNPLFRVAAWVGIVAGVVLIVAVIFFSGFHAGAYSTGGYWRSPYAHTQSPSGPACGMGPGMMPGTGGQTSAPTPPTQHQP